MKKVFLVLSCIIIMATVGYFFLISQKSSINPVIVIGLDGADWNIINPLLERRKLPNLEILINEGSSGIFKTVRPTKSPVIWTSIGTGKTMLKHAVLDWKFVKDNKIEIPYSVDDIRVKFAWEILSDNGFKVGIINWFCTFPASSVNGFLVSDRFRISVDKYLKYDGITFPAKLNNLLYPKVFHFRDNIYSRLIHEEKIIDYLNKSKKLGIKISPSREQQIRNFRRYFLQDKSIENISLFLLEKIPVDFFSVYFRLIDTTSHFASTFIETDLREKWIEENEKFGIPTSQTEKLLYKNMSEIIEPIYVYLDNVIGRIVMKARKNTTFIVISDHGFNFSKVGYNHYETPIIPHGIIIMKGPGIKPGYKLEKVRIYDFTPTILYLFGLPVGKDMDGQVILDAFLKKRKVHYTFTHEKDKISSEKKPRALDKEVLEDLRSLGYIK